MTRAERELKVREVGRRCRGGLPSAIRAQVNEALAAGNEDEAKMLDASSRDVCGGGKVAPYDFNDTVCAGPFDGQDHPYTCPQCGVQGGYTAPLFDE
jgi:hypothetical protein